MDHYGPLKEVVVKRREHLCTSCDICSCNIYEYEEKLCSGAKLVEDSAVIDVNHFESWPGDSTSLSKYNRQKIHICGPCFRKAILPLLVDV